MTNWDDFAPIDEEGVDWSAFEVVDPAPRRGGTATEMRRNAYVAGQVGGGRGFVNPEPVEGEPEPGPASMFDRPDDYRAPRAPGVDPMLNQEGVEAFRANVLAKVQPEDRMAFLESVAQRTDVFGRQAKQLLAQAAAENARITPEAERTAGMLKRGTSAGGGGGAAQKRKVAIPDVTPSYGDTMDYIAPEHIAERRMIAGDVATANSSLDAIGDRDNRLRRDFQAEAFAEENPMVGALASGGGRIVAGTLNAIPALLQYGAEMALGTDISRAPNAPGVDGLLKTVDSLMPAVGRQSMSDAWDKGEFGGWAMTNLAAQTPQIAQSVIAAFVPALRPLVLPAMGATVAGESFGRGDSALASALKGGAEIVSESIPLKVFDKMAGALSKVPPVLRSQILNSVGKALPKVGASVTAQGITGAVEETVAQVLQNGVDRFVEGKGTALLDGVADAAVLGVFASGAMSLPQAAAAMRPRSDAGGFAAAFDADVADAERRGFTAPPVTVAPRRDPVDTILDPTTPIVPGKLLDTFGITPVGPRATEDNDYAPLATDILTNEQRIAEGLAGAGGVPVDGPDLAGGGDRGVAPLADVAGGTGAGVPAPVAVGARDFSYQALTYKPNNDGTIIVNGDPDTVAALVPGVRSIPTSRGILVGKTRAKEVAAAVDAMAPVPESFASADEAKQWATQQGLDNGVQPAQTGDAWGLVPVPKKITVGEFREQTESIEGRLNDVLQRIQVNTVGKPVEIVPDAELVGPVGRAAAVFARGYEAVTGTPVVFARNTTANGVYWEERVIVDVARLERTGGNVPQVLGDLLFTIGHEEIHAGEQSPDPVVRDAYAKLKAIVLSELADPDAVAKRQKWEQGLSKRTITPEYAGREIVADLGGEFMLEPKFWARAYDIDNGSTARKVFYKFMQGSTKVIALLRGAGLNTSIAVKNRDLVREAYVQAWAERVGRRPKEKAAPGAAFPTTLDSNAQQQATGGQTDASLAQDGGDNVPVPRHGTAREGAVSVRGYHFSRSARTRLDGAYFGTAYAGDEKTRLELATDPRIRQRVNFYIDTGQGVRPEAGVGGIRHEVDLDNIYDPATKLIPPQPTSNAFESAVIDAGFDGYMVRDFRTDEGAAVLLGPASRGVPVVQRNGSTVPVGEAAAQTPSPSRQEGQERVSNTPPDLPAIRGKKAVQEAAPSFRFEYGAARVAEAERDAANQALREAGSEVQFSQDTRVGKVDTHILGAQRGERTTDAGTRLSADERAAVRQAASVMKLPMTEVESMVRVHKAAHPVQDGWAALTFTGAKVKEEDGKAELTYLTVPYTFNALDGKSVRPGATAYTQRVGTLAQGMLREVRSVFERAQAGDQTAKNILAQSGWYKQMRTRLRQEFGGLGDLFADLLGATSPNTPVRTNWDNSIEALRRGTNGDFDALMPQWVAWVDNLDQVELEFRSFFDGKVKEGLSKKDIKALPEYAALKAKAKEARALPDALLPTKANGKKFGFNGKNVVRAMVDLWRVVKNADPDTGRGGTAPKAINFSGNLIGFRSRATIDVWAARMLQRLAGGLRIPSMAEGGVSGEALEDGRNTLQFGFGQDVFSAAVKLIRNDVELTADDNLRGINDDDLQALVWFIEKEVWTKGNWTSAAGEGGSFEFEADLAGVADRDVVQGLRKIADSSVASTADQRAQADADILRLRAEMAALPEMAAAAEVLERNAARMEANKTVPKGQKLRPADKVEISAQNKAARASMAKARKGKAYKALERQVTKAQSVLKKPTAEENQATRAGAVKRLGEMSRTADRYTVGLSIQKGAEQGMDPTPPTDSEMAALADTIVNAVLSVDNGATVLGVKAIASEGRYGAPERTLDAEFIVRDGFDARPLAAATYTAADTADQDAAFVARVLRPEEAFDPLTHRPGIEIYFRDMNQAGEAAAMLDEFAGRRVSNPSDAGPGFRDGGVRVPKPLDVGPGYFTIGGYTIIVDGRRTAETRSGAMGKPVGVRILYLPEFEARYGLDSRLENATDAELAAIIQERSDDLGLFAREVLLKFGGVSFAGRFNYEVDTRFAGEYQSAIANLTGGAVKAGAGQAQGPLWRGRSSRESIAAATGRLQVDGGQQGAELPGGDTAQASLSQVADQTNTPAFKRWFGEDSTLVNEDGSPMVVYHGTDRDFTEFRRSTYGAMGPAVYLGDSRDVAEAYAGIEPGKKPKRGHPGRVMAVYARGKYLTNKAWSDYVFKHGWKEAEAAARADGWSGVWDTKFENAVAVWDPKDIKSATDNDGTFGETADIRFSQPDPYAAYDGIQIRQPVLIEDTGQTAYLRLDAGKALRSLDERMETFRKTLDCLSR